MCGFEVARPVRWLRAGLFAVVVAGNVAGSQAASPEVTAIYPAGGLPGQEVSVTLRGKIDAEAATIWSQTPGIEVAAVEGKDKLKLKISAEAAPGIVWLAWQNAEGISSQIPFVIGQFSEQTETEPNNRLNEAGSPLALPMVANGVLQKADDVDSYPVSLRAGETLVAQLDALHLLGSPMDSLIHVCDSRGFVLTQNDDTRDFDPRLTFVAPRDDTYFVRVFAFPSDPNSTIRFAGAATYIYRLSLATSAAIARWQPAAVTTASSASLKGWGWNTPADGLVHEFVAGEPGFVMPAVAQALVLAPVQVTAQPVVARDATIAADQAQVVSIPVCASGSIAARKARQAWKFAATKGQKLHFQVATARVGSPLDALLQVTDSTGKELLEIDDARRDGFDIDAELTIPADGEYTATISDRFWHGGPDYVYTLTILPAAPDFVLTAPANSYVLKSDAPLEIPVTIDRRYGMGAAIKVSAVELPEGVTAEAVTSEPKGDSSKSVKLVLKSTREAEWVGPLQIQGEAEGLPLRRLHMAAVERQMAGPPVIFKVLAKPAAGTAAAQ